jgi:hypothetical protein
MTVATGCGFRVSILRRSKERKSTKSISQTPWRRRTKLHISLAAAAGMTVASLLAAAPASASARSHHQSAVATQASSNLAKQLAALGIPAGTALAGSIPPPPCSWQVAASAYLRISGSNHDYGITDLNYCPATRYVYASGQSYASACNSVTDVDCVAVGLFTSGVEVAGCLATTGQYGCNTASGSDAGVQSYAVADMCLNTSCSQLAYGKTASY